MSSGGELELRDRHCLSVPSAGLSACPSAGLSDVLPAELFAGLSACLSDGPTAGLLVDLAVGLTAV